jgi:hypothetical protein
MQKGTQNDGWFFSTELLFIAERHGYKIFELPVEWRDSGESKVNIARLSRKYLKAMYRIKRIADDTRQHSAN